MNNYRNNDYNNENRTTIYYDDSSNRRMSDERTRRTIERPTEDARAYTKSKSRKQAILLSCAAFALVAAIAVGGMAASGLFTQKPKTAEPAPTAVSATVDKGANKAAQNTKQATPQTQTKQNATAVKPTQNTTQSKSTTQTAQNNKQTAPQQSTSQQTATQQTQKTEDKIENVNGERVYKDTKRQAPDKTGSPAHYYANGKTSYGFNWDYDTDNANFVVKCDYNFNQQQYDFTFYGSTPGTAHVTLYYYTSDTNKVPVNLTVTVDSNLNVTVG
jgi:cytoskeletal protein RodZ